jgi:hypothetical protein
MLCPLSYGGNYFNTGYTYRLFGSFLVESLSDESVDIHCNRKTGMSRNYLHIFKGGTFDIVVIISHKYKSSVTFILWIYFKFDICPRMTTVFREEQR